MLKVSAIDTSSFVNWFSFFYLNIHEDIIDVKDSYKKNVTSLILKMLLYILCQVHENNLSNCILFS